MESENQLIEEMSAGIWAWYDFSREKTLLFADGNKENLSDFSDILPEFTTFESLDKTVDKDFIREHSGEFDYIISIEGLERQENPRKILALWKKLLKADGKLLLGFNNRYGLRYFCGDRDIYTERNFDGVENYQNLGWSARSDFKGRMYSRAEISETLKSAGFSKFRFYAALPDLKHTALIYAEDALPTEDLSNRLFPMYNHPDVVFLEEKKLYDGIIKNGMFHLMANAYFVECTLNGELSDIAHATSSLDRGKERAFITVIRREKTVEKRAVYKEGQENLRVMAKNMEYIKERGICTIEGKFEGEKYITPYTEGKNALLYLKRLIDEDWDKFLYELDKFCELVKKSSDIETDDAGDGLGAVLRYGYLDMVPWNAIFKDGEFFIFDQEFVVEHYPLNAIIMRTIVYLQSMIGDVSKKDFLYKRYGIFDKLNELSRTDMKFLGNLRNLKTLSLYRLRYEADAQTLNTNRLRINYSEEEYQKLFVDIFKHIENKKIILFGSGRFAQTFMDLYANRHKVEFIVDNQKSRQGETLQGVPIYSPNKLLNIAKDEYRVIICVKKHLFILRQLKEMGIEDIAIFDQNRDYPEDTPQRIVVSNPKSEEDTKPKKYRKGYIAGVFDLFHIGHLNMFKRAKEQCEYLIVGVVTDEGVRTNKGVEPFIPFEERIEMVRSCKYVDEAVEIPTKSAGTREAWKMYHFDAQFSGSDYIDDIYWLTEGEFLKKHGAELVFFPYTEQTSSTKIKALINKRLS